MKENKLTNQQEIKPVAQQFPYQLISDYFLACPFCGNFPNVFQVPENRYGIDAPYGWIVQCKNMGCVIYKEDEPNTGDQSLEHLMQTWNTRAVKI